MQQYAFEKGLERQRACGALESVQATSSGRLAVQDSTASGSSSSRGQRIDADLKVLAAACTGLDSARPSKLSAEAQQMILRVHIANQMRRLEARKKRKVRYGTVSESIYKITGDMCGVSERTVARVWTDYCKGKMLVGYKPPPEAAAAVAAEKNSRIRSHQDVVNSIREFVRAKHQDHRQVTAVDVTHHLVDTGELDADLSNKKQLDAAVRCTQRWLVKHGWQRGKKNAKTKMKETVALREARALYLRTVKQNREGEKLREVFTDETYIHQHYHSDDRTLYDPRDDDDNGTKKHNFKGDRYNIVGCILGPDLTKPEEERQDTLADKGGWYTNAYAKFHAPLRRAKDYHACFDATWYERWFRKVCASLRDDGHKCIFYLDNVSYHKATDFNKLKKVNRDQLFTAMKQEYARRGLDPTFWDRFVTKKALLEFMSTLPAVTGTCIQRIAEEHGHKVAYTPAYHSDLQPIEMVWACAKGKVARKYHH